MSENNNANDLSDLLDDTAPEQEESYEYSGSDDDGSAQDDLDPNTVKKLRQTSAKLHRITKAKAQSLKAADKASKDIARIVTEILPEMTNASSAPATGTPVAPDPTKDKELKPLLPAKDKIRIYRRDTDGKLALVNDYTAQEISTDGDIQAFVNKRIRPTYGDFDYEIFLINAVGREVQHGTIPRKNPRQDGDGETVSAMRMLVETLKDSMNKPQQSKENSLETFESLSRLMAAQQKIDPIAMMMLPMIKQSMMEGNGHKGPEIELLSKLADRIDRIEDASRVPPPAPFMMPPVAPAEPQFNLAELVTTLATVMKPAPLPPPPPPQPNPIIEAVEKFGPLLAPLLPVLVAKLTENKNQPNMEMIEMRHQMERQMDSMKAELVALRSQPTPAQIGNRSLADMLEEQQRLQAIARQLVPQPPPGPPVSESFWTFLQSAWETLPANLASVRDIVAQSKMGGMAPPSSAGGQPRQQLPPGHVEVEIPGDIKEHSDRLEKAESKEDVLGAMFGFVQALSKFQTWKKPIGLLMFRAKQGNHDGMAEAAQKIFQVFVDKDLIDVEVANKCLRVFQENIAEIAEAMAKFA